MNEEHRNKNGAPVGKKLPAPVVDIRSARKALKAVKARAMEGSPEDQRTLLGVFYASLPRHNPYGGFVEYQPLPILRTSLLDPPERQTADVHDIGGDDAA